MKKFLRDLLVVLAICSAIGMLAPFYWLFDLFNHWRIQAAIASAVIALLALFIDRKLAVRAGCIFLLNAILIAVPLYRTAGIAPLESEAENHADQRVSVIASNVLAKNTDYPAVLAMVAREKPDIVVFVETNARWIRNLAPLEKEYPYKFTHPRPDNFGIAAYSKLPFNGQVQDIGYFQLPLAVLDFDRFTLLVAHPPPPIFESNMKENQLYLKTIAEQVQTNDRPVLVAGDFNATLWSDTLSPLVTAGFKRINPWGIAYTWPIGFFPVALQIDHFFAKGIAAGNFRVLEEVGSDHYPIRAELLIP